MNAIMVSTEGLYRRLMYTAFSRVTSLNGLFLNGFYKRPLPATVENDATMREMQRMNLQCPLKFCLCFPEDVKNNNNILAIFHNVRSLNLHLQDICTSPSFTACDLIFACRNMDTTK